LVSAGRGTFVAYKNRKEGFRVITETVSPKKKKQKKWGQWFRGGSSISRIAKIDNLGARGGRGITV